VAGQVPGRAGETEIYQSSRYDVVANFRVARDAKRAGFEAGYADLLREYGVTPTASRRSTPPRRASGWAN